MAVLHWDDEAIIIAMIAYHDRYSRWPKSRDWWFANKDEWPSFTTVCLRPLKWKGLLKLAKEKVFASNQFETKGTLFEDS